MSRKQRISRIKDQCARSGLGFQIFNYKHMRIFGLCTVDYWPGTSRAWVVGGGGKAEKMTPEQAVDLARVGVSPEPTALDLEYKAIVGYARRASGGE